MTTQHELLTLAPADAVAPRFTVLGVAMRDDSTAYVIASDDQYSDRSRI
ncbi:MAG TPA: hypothetical protein VLN49_00195 [Gemmatimonadaceae bacterium]|nr:hypothetical protein [Gemmatimonadaceae bacterium]